MKKKGAVMRSRALAVGVLLAGVATTSMACAQDAGSWTLKTPLPAIRAEVSAAVVGDKLHAVGGATKGVAGPYHDEYDPATDRWRPRAPMPEGRDHLGVTVLNGKIY